MRVLLIGGGDLCKQIAYYINTYDKKVLLIGYVDDFAKVDEFRFGLRCIGSISNILMLYNKDLFDKVIICIGYSHLIFRKKIFDDISFKVPFYTFIHPTAFIDNSARIGNGCFIGPGSIIEQYVSISNNVFIYGGVNISHDVIISSNSFIAPSAVIAGFVNIGQCCFIGLRSVIIERIRIGDNVKIGAASLVLNHLIEPGLYIGSPVQKR